MIHRRMPIGRLFEPILVAPDGSRHLLINRTDPAWCGETEGTRYPPAWTDRNNVCQRCLQKFMKQFVETPRSE